MHNHTDVVVVLCTLPNDMNFALKLIKKLLKLKLAACITLLDNAKSFYYWKNNLTNTTEIQLLIKTKTPLTKLIYKTIKNLHPYQIPELLTIPIIDGESNYLMWITDSLNLETHNTI